MPFPRSCDTKLKCVGFNTFECTPNYASYLDVGVAGHVSDPSFSLRPLHDACSVRWTDLSFFDPLPAAFWSIPLLQSIFGSASFLTLYCPINTPPTTA